MSYNFITRENSWVQRLPRLRGFDIEALLSRSMASLCVAARGMSCWFHRESVSSCFEQRLVYQVSIIKSAPSTREAHNKISLYLIGNKKPKKPKKHLNFFFSSSCKTLPAHTQHKAAASRLWRSIVWRTERRNVTGRLISLATQRPRARK